MYTENRHSSSVTQRRNILLDVLKGFAMVCVILGHAIQLMNGEDYSTSGFFFDNVVFRLVYSFHMPLFAVISGYLYFYSQKKYSFLKNCSNKAQQLIIPIFSLFVFYTFAELCFAKADINFLLIKNTAIHAIGSLWFLYSIFGGFLFASILAKRNKLYQEVSLVCLIIIILFCMRLPFLHNVVCFIIFFYMVGYEIAKHIDGLSHIEKRFRPCLFALSVGGVLFLMFAPDRYHLYTNMNIISDYREFITGFLVRILLSSMSVYLVFRVFDYLIVHFKEAHAVKPVVETLVLNSYFSLGLYFFQCFLLSICLDYLKLTEDVTAFSWLGTFVYFLVIYGASLLLCLVCNRARILRRLIMGILK